MTTLCVIALILIVVAAFFGLVGEFMNSSLFDKFAKLVGGLGVTLFFIRAIAFLIHIIIEANSQ